MQVGVGVAVVPLGLKWVQSAVPLDIKWGQSVVPLGLKSIQWVQSWCRHQHCALSHA
jgi:hypothetical protein